MRSPLSLVCGQKSTLSSSILAKRALCSAVSKDKSEMIRLIAALKNMRVRCITRIPFPILPPLSPAPVPVLSLLLDRARVFAVNRPLLLFVLRLESLGLEVFPSQLPQHAHACVVHDRYARLLPIAPVCVSGLLS